MKLLCGTLEDSLDNISVYDFVKLVILFHFAYDSFEKNAENGAFKKNRETPYDCLIGL